MIVVVAGVSGSGKSVIGRALAARLGCAFEEGDDLHPAANIAKMAAGIPLDDADRRPWLDAVAAWIERLADPGENGVVSCSALKRAYRDRLRGAAKSLVFVMLDPPVASLRARLATRAGHFMPPDLLDSQLATLERPAAEEDVLLLDGDTSIEAACTAILVWLSERAARSGGMRETIDDLRRQMEAAAHALDFEEAKRLRDRIGLMRGGADSEDVRNIDTSDLARQQPGSMGLGTSQQRITPPPDWTPPSKPDPMTRGRSRPRGRRS